jgi:hypothetical protein
MEIRQCEKIRRNNRQQNNTKTYLILELSLRQIKNITLFNVFKNKLVIHLCISQVLACDKAIMSQQNEKKSPR